MRKPFAKKTLCAVAISAALVFSVSGLGEAQAQQAGSGSNASYTSYTTFSSENKVPQAKPKWSADLSLPSADGTRDLIAPIIVSGNVIYVNGGKLTARNVKTGKTVWTFGTKLKQGALQTDGRVIYAYGEKGMLYWVDSATGRNTRSYQLLDSKSKKVPQDILGISLSNGALYASYASGIVSISTSNGRENWRNETFYIPNAPYLINGTLLMDTYESGAITVGTAYAIDPKTGKTKWRLPGSHSALLKADGDKLYYADQWPDIDNPQTRIDVFSLSTGEKLQTITYMPVEQEGYPANSYVQSYFGNVLIDGQDLYLISQRQGVYRYNLNADPKVVKPAFIQDNGTLIAGPYHGKLFFTDERNMSLHVRKIVDQSYVTIEGVNNPISQLNLIDSGMYVGQTDGTVYAINVTTGKALFRYQTGARAYGTFQTVGDTLLVQAENKLYAFALPAELTKPLKAASQDSNYSKAQAKLTIDGVEKTFQPSMMTAANRMFVPFRFLTEAVGAKVTYDQATKQATVTYGDRVFTIADGAPYALVAGEQTALSAAPATINGSLYVPVKDIGNLLGISVVWNASTRTVEVKTKA
ncbi:copper amine oxidase domain protein [Paenibacillus curdlanolyticus YK9]|uniref:Copper amine oxidase domain protein n=1 Tax=Paenibacillus curdlanolyticus YK9 TaxID=717606 RepID=E0I628_9BACL|nr:stalk domain-containing protein [Paenibacillus curdlanolyticus]EFM12420.1 copper amine oxidase domain protein [Paenibacillus curdlanolyticus YK9]